MMRPAFSSLKLTAAFTGLLLWLLLAPWLAGQRFLPPRAEIYSSVAWRFGAYPYLEQQIFQKTNAIDIAFLGSSHMWWGVNAPYVQAALSRHAGRPATVVTLGWEWPGFDAVYFIAKDLLQHRRLQVLVICDEQPIPYRRPQTMSHRWFRYGDDWADLTGLSLPLQAAYYSGAILGLPRNLLGLVRPNLPADLTATPYLNDKYHAANPATTMGSLGVCLPYQVGGCFVPFQPSTGVSPAATCIYSPATAASFKFTGPATTPLQAYFARKIMALAKANHVQVVFLHFPTDREIRSPLIHERECWPEILAGHPWLVGVPPAAMFQGLNDEDAFKCFSGPDHFSKNGQDFFTAMITPSLLSVYDASTHH